MTGDCQRCGEIHPLASHHPLLKGCDGKYLFPRFKVPWCEECHGGLHRMLQRWRLDERSKLPLAVLVVARLAAHFAWLAMADRPITFTQRQLRDIAQTLKLVADMLKNPERNKEKGTQDD